MMAVAISCLEARAVTCPKSILALIRHEHHLAGDDIDELVCLGVRVMLARPSARGQRAEVDTELSQSSRIAELDPASRSTRLIIGRRIVHAVGSCCRAHPTLS